MKIGLILGGGGEVGIAWELGVLAALKAGTGFGATDCAVVVGTSAGAYVGALTSHGADLDQLMAAATTGPGLSPTPVDIDPDAPVDPGRGSSVIPDDIAALMVSFPGTVEERAVAIGKLALTAPTALDGAQFVGLAGAMLGVDTWPEVDFRPTSVNAETGATVLWSRRSGVGLVPAVASSFAIPGFFPPVEINGGHYIDVPRARFTEDLVREASLDAIVYVGLVLPVLVNTDELATLEVLAEKGMPIATITNGPEFNEIADDLMNPAVRARAAVLGQEDGHRAAARVRELLGG
ncbi:patatin-like phospholipase family protein [Nonomuraea endophytica]|uniref:patatin-like phospholipase family protein n=1 Tax=Nonomuraea endophytica TaxID=714136 RepID=UPI0037C5BF41